MSGQDDGGIRLLKLHLGTPDDKIVISFSLAHYDINYNDTIRYEALSYVWGSLTDKESIICNGGSLAITHGLLHAMRHLHSKGGHRTLWIDAICINQSDDQERSTQVPLMKFIFLRASSVLIWLGRGNPEMFELLQLWLQGYTDQFTNMNLLGLQGYSDQFTDMNQLGLQGYSDRFNKKTKKTLFEGPAFERLAEFIDFLLLQPWWHRTWTFQEVCLARNAEILWGNRSIPWRVFQEHGRGDLRMPFLRGTEDVVMTTFGSHYRHTLF